MNSLFKFITLLLLAVLVPIISGCSSIVPVVAVDNLGNQYFSASLATTDMDNNGKLLPPGVFLVDYFFSSSLDPKAEYIATIDVKMQPLPRRLKTP